MKPKVINIRSAPAGWRFNEQYVYIGRKNLTFGVQESPFHNPYKLHPGESRGATLEKYKKYLAEKLENPVYKQAVKELAGKTLVCWCSPHPCHGDILATVCEELNKENN
jgi:hypothetical protein